jgi:hypothetical protein
LSKEKTVSGALAVVGALLVIGAGELADSITVSRQLDERIAQACQEATLSPASPADDLTFLRRAWLDLAGRTPPVAEVRKALTNSSTLSREKLIDQLLASPDAAKHWARLWAEYYLDERPFDAGVYNGRLLQRYLFEAFQNETPYDAVARDLLASGGASDVSGPANLLLKYEANPQRLAATVSKKFMGCTLQCAECHDHPHTHWKQQDFWGLAAFFARLRRMNPVEEPEGDQFSVVLERQRGELKVADPDGEPGEDGAQPMKTVYPRTPGGATLDLADNRRETLVAWLTRPENPYFARHFVSRTWAEFFGEDLAASLDDLGAQPSPSLSDKTASADLKGQILDLLAADFSASGYDVKRLLRVIVGSEAYQRAAAPSPGSAGSRDDAAARESLEVRCLARFPIRPLTADQLYLSVAQATGFRGDDYDRQLAEVTQEDFSYDLPGQYFGAEGLMLTRSVALLNGDYVRGAAEMAAEATRRLYGQSPGAQHIEWMFLSALGRRPSPDEMETMLNLAGHREGGLPDVAWALLNSAEFNTVH